MKKTLKKYWQLFWHFRRIQLMRMMEYRGDFFFWTFISLMWTSFNFFFFTLLIAVNNNISGWSAHELYLLLGFYTMSDSLIWSLYYVNMQNYRRLIYNGEFSNLLLKPVNSIFMLMTSVNSYNNIPRFFVGLGVIIWSLNQLNLTPSLEQVIAVAIVFTIAQIFIYFLWFLITTSAFWFERLDNVIEIVPALRRIFEYPGSIYTGLFSFIFTTLLPVILVTTLPAETLIYQPNWQLTAYFALIAGITLTASLVFYRYSVKKYSGIGN